MQTVNPSLSESKDPNPRKWKPHKNEPYHISTRKLQMNCSFMKSPSRTGLPQSKDSSLKESPKDFHPLAKPRLSETETRPFCNGNALGRVQIQAAIKALLLNPIWVRAVLIVLLIFFFLFLLVVIALVVVVFVVVSRS